jgi:hypothetical protein
MVIKIDWKKLGYKEYHNLHYSSIGGASIDSRSIINIEDKKYYNNLDLYIFNNLYLDPKDAPFPIEGIICMTQDVTLARYFPDIVNILEFTDRVMQEVERYGKYEGSFGIELLDIGISHTGGLDQNTNPFRLYKFIRIL